MERLIVSVIVSVWFASCDSGDPLQSRTSGQLTAEVDPNSEFQLMVSNGAYKHADDFFAALGFTQCETVGIKDWKSLLASLNVPKCTDMEKGNFGTPLDSVAVNLSKHNGLETFRRNIYDRTHSNCNGGLIRFRLAYDHAQGPVCGFQVFIREFNTRLLYAFAADPSGKLFPPSSNKDEQCMSCHPDASLESGLSGAEYFWRWGLPEDEQSASARGRKGSL